MGRIHRYGQEKDCLILNFVSSSTREGRVLHKLFERVESIENDLDPKKTGKVFNVLGDIFPATELERMLRDMYAHNQTEESIKNRIIEQVDIERFRTIAQSTLEGLAKRELNLSAIIGKSAEAKERRLVPEVIEDFFIQSGQITGVIPKEIGKNTHIYRLGRIPKTLWPLGEKLEPQFGKLGREYKNITFDKKLLNIDPTLDWITPGHPLFECVRMNVLDNVQDDLRSGTVFYNLHSNEPYRLDVFLSSIKDGRDNILHQRIFVVESKKDGSLEVRQPTIFLDLTLAPKGTNTPDETELPDRIYIEQTLIEKALNPYLQEIAKQRIKETEIVSRHLEISLNELINRQNLRLAELVESLEKGDNNPLIPANIKITEDKIDELSERLERRRRELLQERNCTIADVKYYGSAWVLPHPERTSPGFASMVRDEEIETIAINSVIKYEESKGWQVTSVEKENRGFDLISRKPHPEDPQTAMEVKFIEVKGRAAVGEISLTTNEYKTAERLKKDYWLYVVYKCATEPEIYTIQNPAALNWESIVKVEHYQLSADKVLEADK